MATRQNRTYYWQCNDFISRSFPTVTTAKANLLKAANKNNNIFGRNKVYFVENSISDVAIGWYGISKKWNRA